MKTLIVEDEKEVLEALRDALGGGSWQIDFAQDGKSALKKIEGVDLLVTDLRLPGMDGLELLGEARRRKPNLPVIIMTGYGTIPSAVEAMRRGARAYLTKPFDPEELVIHMRQVEEVLRARESADRFSRGALVGASHGMQKVYQEIDLAARSDAAVLITGETGTGKELAARAIHDLSARRSGPFIAVNVGALPRDLVEGELFGREKGAYTGADSKKRGRFSLAHGGSLFLDELTSMPIELQPKLLRAIETKEIWPLGSDKGEIVDARIIAATNADVEKQVKAQALREDLYYRLHVHRVKMPPLRERPDDIPILARVLLDRARESVPLGISPEALTALIGRSWPGNVRELANVLETAAIRCQAQKNDTIAVKHLDPAADSLPALPFKEAKEKMSDDWSRQVIRSALAATDGNISKAAALLKMNQNALFRLIKKLGVK